MPMVIFIIALSDVYCHFYIITSPDLKIVRYACLTESHCSRKIIYYLCIVLYIVRCRRRMSVNEPQYTIYDY